MPKVSVIMSSYNHEKFVAAAIESVVKQSFQDWELLIMDDQSTDKTFNISKDYENKDRRIKVFKSPYNRGMVQNTNELISVTQGEYIATINSDDSWQIEKLEKQIRFLDENPEYGVCFTTANMIGEDNEIIYSRTFNKLKNRSRYEWLNSFFYFGNSLCYPSSLARKICYLNVGLFNPAFIVLLDLDMWIKICLAGYEIHVIQEKLTNFRLLKNEANLSGIKPSSMVRNYLESQRLLYNYSTIKDFEEFSKIFPNYSTKSLNNHPGFIYLIDLIIQSFFTTEKINNMANIQNFGLNFLYEKISSQPDFLKILEKDFGFDFKKYIKITGLYPAGINFCEKKMAKKRGLLYQTKSLLKSWHN
jgi:glycosyltransferase involved in cell wall biosynthesis